MVRCMSLLAWLQLRERDWANVLTAHEGDPSAYTWRLSHLTLGEHVLRPPRKIAKVGPTSLCLTMKSYFAECC